MLEHALHLGFGIFNVFGGFTGNGPKWSPVCVNLNKELQKNHTLSKFATAAKYTLNIHELK
jgi:hypothetical protein